MIVLVLTLLVELGIMVGWMFHRSKQEVFFNTPEFIETEIGEENDTSNND